LGRTFLFSSFVLLMAVAPRFAQPLVCNSAPKAKRRLRILTFAFPLPLAIRLHNPFRVCRELAAWLKAYIPEVSMINLNEIKITSRDEQVLKLLVQGCSNKEIAAQLRISPRTVKQHLRTLFLRAGIRDGRKRVKLATAMFQKEQMKHASL
jgi:DNA-binding CsgD family transcriptional regulator